MANKVYHRDPVPLIIPSSPMTWQELLLSAPSSTEAEFLDIHMIGQNKVCLFWPPLQLGVTV